MRGQVVQLNVKPETQGERGLPKRPAEAVTVTPHGVHGDYNRYRQEDLAGDPTSAVLVIPLETIDQLNAEGWPIKPGDLGENITTRGIPYDAMAPGTRLRVGGCEIEIARACDPCTNLYELPYVGREKGPRFVKTLVGRRGWYARVLRDGSVRRGDAVETL